MTITPMTNPITAVNIGNPATKSEANVKTKIKKAKTIPMISEIPPTSISENVTESPNSVWMPASLEIFMLFNTFLF
ncbi:hypothetical protein BsIDN1_33920 [Bacillus safensis]|uniref:Uncharacterized protein n=1 Tax=Bacillus safensis TaxID=561879 RepID=A0A5S9MC83_BACIA|nr:hypothetical protein BsIDN1_33920 [Bacillus safensis]